MIFLVALIAFLYASVGHAGASGYIAVMTLFHLVPTEIKPAALILNILVASIALFKFSRRGFFSWRLLWPFVIASIPAAFFGGGLSIPGGMYKKIVGVILVYVVTRLFLEKRVDVNIPRFVNPPPAAAAMLWGAGMGFISGLIGVGGGIFLTPLLVLQRWSCVKTAAGVSAAFILFNSAAGFAGFLQHGRISMSVLYLIPAALLGGYAGAELGSRYFPGRVVRIFLVVVLAIAAVKLLFQG